MTLHRLQKKASRGKPVAVGDTAGDDKDLPARLIALYVTKTIIGTATYEGAALLLGVAYLIERSQWNSALAVVLIAGLLVQMPTRDRAQRWLDHQLRQLQE